MAKELELDEIDESVLEALIGFHGAMPFLELTSISDIDDKQLEQRVSELEKRGLVRITNPDDVMERIVSVTGEGLKLTQLKQSA